MTERDEARKKLIEQLDKVNTRLQILDMIEDKLLNMKKLSQRVIEEDLIEKEIQDINKKVQALVAELELLDSEPTQLS